MTMTERFGTGFVILVTAGLLFQFCWIPFRCDIELGKITAETRQAVEAAGAFEPRVRARSNLERAQSHCARCGRSIDALMTIAANLRLVGRHAEACDTYLEALAIQKRPEVYRNLAEAQLALGDRNAAIESYAQAARFSSHVFADIYDPLLRDEIDKRVKVR